MHRDIRLEPACVLTLRKWLLALAVVVGLAAFAAIVWFGGPLIGFGDSRVDHEILVWISDPEGGVSNVKSDVLNRLWHLFRDNGIIIPYPQRVIHAATAPMPSPAPDLSATP